MDYAVSLQSIFNRVLKTSRSQCWVASTHNASILTALPAIAKQNTERDHIWEVKTYQNSIYKHAHSGSHWLIIAYKVHLHKNVFLQKFRRIHNRCK